MFWDWLKEWSPILSLVAMIAIAYLIARMDNHQRAVNRRIRELNEIIDWVEETIKLVDEYNQQPNPEQAMKVHSRAIRLTPQLKLIASKKSNPSSKPLFATTKDEFSKFLGLLEKQLGLLEKDVQDNKKENQIARGELLTALYELQRKASDLKINL